MDSVAQLYLNEEDYLLNYGVSINNAAAHYYDQGQYLKAMEGYKKALNILDTIVIENLLGMQGCSKKYWEIEHQTKSFGRSTNIFSRSLEHLLGNRRLCICRVHLYRHGKRLLRYVQR